MSYAGRGLPAIPFGRRRESRATGRGHHAG
jgi:hypothetical protein